MILNPVISSGGGAELVTISFYGTAEGTAHYIDGSGVYQETNISDGSEINLPANSLFLITGCNSTSYDNGIHKVYTAGVFVNFFYAETNGSIELSIRT